MNAIRTIAIFLLASFLWTQAAAAVHVSEHGLAHHQHEGKECEFVLFLNQGATPDSAPALPVPVAYGKAAPLTGTNAGYCLAADHLPCGSRAPPTLS